jgi:hypothetical protein
MPGGVTCLANFAEYFNTNYGGNYPTAGTGLDAVAGFCPVAAEHGVVFMYAGVPLPTDPDACGATPCSPTVTLASPLNGGGFPNSTWRDAYPPEFFDRYSRMIDHGYWGGFVQDQWRITPKLTLNYGLRWDVETGLGQFVKNDYNQWQPRVGIAYSPDEKTVIRAGFGMFFDRQNLTFFFVPNTQKIVAGYQCDNHAPAAIEAICSAAGVLPQQFPNIMSDLGQAKQGYQLLAFPANPGPPGSPCAGVPEAPCAAASIIQTGAYDTAFPGVTMAGTCTTTGACGIGMGGMDQNTRNPYATQASFQIDRQFGGGLAVSLNYLFVGAHKLVRGNNINIPCPVGTTKSGPPTDPSTLFPGGPPVWVPGWLNADGTLTPCDGTPTLGSGALAGLGPFFGGALGSGLRTISAGLEDYNNGVSNANYHGGSVTVTERIKNFSMTANYTYSHTLDDGNFTTFINLPVNQFDYTNERANSNQDLRHRFVTNFTATGPENTFLRHFTLSSIITMQTGRPFTLFYGNNTLNDVAGGATDRVGGAPITPRCNTVDHCATMISRNTYVGDRLYAWDFHLGRYFQLTERMKIELGVDAFNFLNRPNVDEVTSVYGSPVFCGTTPAIPRHYNDSVSRAIQAQAASTACPVGDVAVIPGVGSLASAPTDPGAPPRALFIPANPNPTFGLPRTMLNPRQFQFSLKFSF